MTQLIQKIIGVDNPNVVVNAKKHYTKANENEPSIVITTKDGKKKVIVNNNNN